MVSSASSHDRKQLVLDFSAVPAPASRPESYLRAFLGRMPTEQLALPHAPGSNTQNGKAAAPAPPPLSSPRTVGPSEGRAAPDTPPGVAATEPEPPRNPHNYRITDSDRLGSGSLKAKCHDNLAAIERLKQIEADDRRP